MVETVTAAHCLRCDWVPDGDPDRDAERHTKKTGHPTATVTEPSSLASGRVQRELEAIR